MFDLAREDHAIALFGFQSGAALATVVGVLVDPHIFDYDLTVLVLAALLVGTVEPRARWWFLGFYALLFLREPLPVGDQFFQPTVPVLVAFAVWLWKHVGRLSLTAANERLTEIVQN